MTLWIMFSALTAGLLAILLRPLLAARAPAAPSAAAQEMAVYRDQLAELERDAARGVIAAPEAEAARAEVGRRLIAAAAAAEAAEQAAPQGSPRLRRAVAFASVIILPLAAISLYGWKGSPDMPALPHAARLANAEKNGDMPALVAKIEAHLKDHPEDLRGWKLLVPVYMKMRRYDDAVTALKEIAAQSPPDAGILTDLGEALTLAKGGEVVPPEAATAFAEALKLEPKNPKARYFAALAQADAGDRAGARAALEALKADSPAGAPWLALVDQQIAALDGAPAAAAQDAPAPAPAPGMPQLSSEKMAAAKDMTPEQRQQMIHAMVDGLAERLAANGKDIEGWLRLARARVMLGEKDKAVAALDDAAKNYDGDAAALARISDMRRALGL